MGFRHALTAAVIGWATIAHAQEGPVAPDHRIKAAFLSKFAAYVEWPAGAFTAADSPIVIGVASADPIAGELELAVAGRKVAERPLQVRRLARGEPVHDCCQILFVGGASRTRPDVLAQAQGKPVLTVTEVDDGHPRGSIINFIGVENRVRFDISREAAERNGLKLASSLLAVARKVSSP